MVNARLVWVKRTSANSAEHQSPMIHGEPGIRPICEFGLKHLKTIAQK
jgi:hypothetical protein